jgi:DNA repair protein RadC
LASEILNSCGNNLDELAKLSVEALCAIPGLGQAKAMGLAAAFELGLRRQVPVALKPSIRSSTDAYRIMRPHLVDLHAEAFLVLYMNRRHAVIRLETLSMGGISSTVVDVRLLLKRALELGATALIVGHNHPSGNLNPSPQDRSLTEQLKKASRFLDLELLDHLVVTEAGYTSFSDEGLLEH